MGNNSQTGFNTGTRESARLGILPVARAVSYAEKTSRRMVFEQVAMALLIVALWLAVG